MEQDRFDDLVKQVFAGSSRRRVVGGAIASVVGAGFAAVTGVEAKKGKAKAKKGKAKGEFVCTAANANDPLQGGCPPGSCCQSTPAGNNAACVAAGVQAGSQTCGDPTAKPAGGGVCRTCPTGTRCSGAPDFRCVCDPTTCSNGCCIPGFTAADDDVCVANGSGAPVSSSNPDYDGTFVCGTAGSICTVCSIGGTLFSGCCTASGACSGGTSNANCGSNGQLCETCQNDAECGVDQACTGGTTTPSPTSTTTLAPCPIAKNGKQKIRCGQTCCGRKQECKTADDGTQHCKRKKRFL